VSLIDVWERGEQARAVRVSGGELQSVGPSPLRAVVGAEERGREGPGSVRLLG
jgi:hypothetical protein